jgi:hypothetical protein
MITGPQNPGVKSQIILPREQHVDWIADCLQYLRDHRFTLIEAERDAEDAWVQHNNVVADRTLYALANSWYLGGNISEEPPSICRMWVPSPQARRNVIRSRARDTKVFVWVFAFKRRGLLQIDRIDDLIIVYTLDTLAQHLPN